MLCPECRPNRSLGLGLAASACAAALLSAAPLAQAQPASEPAAAEPADAEPAAEPVEVTAVEVAAADPVAAYERLVATIPGDLDPAVRSYLLAMAAMAVADHEAAVAAQRRAVELALEAPTEPRASAVLGARRVQVLRPHSLVDAGGAW